MTHTDTPDPAPGPSSPKTNWSLVVTGLALVATSLAIMFAIDLSPGFAEKLSEGSQSVLRIVVIFFLALGSTIAFSAFFRIDIKASFKLPFLKDGSAQAVGALIVTGLISVVLWSVLPEFGAPKAAPKDPLAEMKAELATLLDDHYAELALKVAERDSVVVDALLSEDRKVVAYTQLLENMLTDKDSPFKLATQLVVMPEPPDPRFSTASLKADAQDSGIGGVWLDRAQRDRGQQLTSIRPQIGPSERKSFFLLEGQDEHAGVTFVELDPDTMTLNVMMYLSGRNFCQISQDPLETLSNNPFDDKALQ